ncbi:MAG: radical SAM protein [Candidatus Methanomethylicia archaeon]|nr:radical SAM protein [Candidatus Methanomethylicia archaeon]MCX8168937.1 radical SAM protein [Candidatus Methanomethylicia archaeon]MDW7988669.1 radical SAM protein [Nitrososphaerota archaeon]
MNILDIPLRKMMLKEEFRRRLPEKSIVKAAADLHAKRKPRPCGLTIHPAIGCTNQCVYCYIQDMGFPFNKITPYGLSGPELAHALLSNPYYMPTINGTYLAIGSITEPFHKIAINKTMEYLKALEELGNPTQFSTKEYINEEIAKRIAKIKVPISPLITIVTIQKKDILEPNAPDIDLRLKTIRNLRIGGLKPIIFIRPILPGVTDKEAEDIIVEAKNAGAVGAVVGGFRVTTNIIKRLSKSGVDLKIVVKTTDKKDLGKRKQVSVESKELKNLIMEIVKEKGLKAFSSSCCANAYISETTCINLCKDAIRNIPRVNIDDVNKLVKMIIGKKVKDVVINDKYMRILMEERLTAKMRKTLKYNLKTIFRRRVDIL